MHKKQAHRIAVVGAAVASALMLTACTAGPSANSASSTSSAAAGSAVPASVVSTAKSLISQYSSMPTFTSPGPALDASKEKGKKILVIDMDQVAAQLVTINKGITAATQAVGMSATFFNGNDTASTLQQGIAQGINEKVAAIVLNGVPPALVPNSISAAKAAGIPVIADTTGLSEPSGVFGASSVDFTLLGKLMASAAVVQQNGNKVDAALIQFTNPLSPLVTQGITSVFNTCNGNCTVAKTDTIEPNNWPTQVSPAASSLVQANPNLTSILAFDDTMGQFATTGVKSSGSTTVKVIGAQGSGEGPLALVKAGGTYIADPGQSSLWIGWGAVDQVLRALLKMSPGDDKVPPRYLDSSTLESVDVSNPDSVYGNAYVAGYKKAWGLG